jgi:hypothetical protein
MRVVVFDIERVAGELAGEVLAKRLATRFDVWLARFSKGAGPLGKNDDCALERVYLEGPTGGGLEPSEFDLAFVHWTQESRARRYSNSGLHATRIVGFTAGGVWLRKRDDAPNWLYRQIAGEVMTDEECQELAKWAAGEQAELPKVLVCPTPIDTVAALAILCQGYLVAWACTEGKGTGVDIPPRVSCALVQMGWFEERSLRPRLQLSLGPDDWLNVQDPQWWLVPLTGARRASRDQGTGSVAALRAAIQGELLSDPIPAGVAGLLDALAGGVVADPVTVAQAYCVLAALLGGVPCANQ